jgi:hypothetical protein
VARRKSPASSTLTRLLLLTTLPLASAVALGQPSSVVWPDASGELAPPENYDAAGEPEVLGRPGGNNRADIEFGPGASTAPQPAAPDLTGIVKDANWARILGKALFWDTVAGVQNPKEAVGANIFFAALTGEVRGGASNVLDLCSGSAAREQSEVPDSGPLAPNNSPPADPSCLDDLAARLAREVLQHRPLDARKIDPNDAVFGQSGPHGNLIGDNGQGLERTYQWMIQQAFDEKLWNMDPSAPVAGPEGTPGAVGPLSAAIPDPYRRIERNFPLFWGVSIMLYEASLTAEPAHDSNPKPAERKWSSPKVSGGPDTFQQF